MILWLAVHKYKPLNSSWLSAPCTQFSDHNFHTSVRRNRRHLYLYAYQHQTSAFLHFVFLPIKFGSIIFTNIGFWLLYWHIFPFDSFILTSCAQHFANDISFSWSRYLSPHTDFTVCAHLAASHHMAPMRNGTKFIFCKQREKRPSEWTAIISAWTTNLRFLIL